MQKNRYAWKSAWLNITEKCNLNCDYCFIRRFENKNRPRKDMSEKVAMTSMEYLYNYGGEGMAISFFGGEPLIRFDLIKKIMIKYPSLLYMISTNTILLNDEIIDFFASKKDFIHIILSIDGDNSTQLLNRGSVINEDVIKKILLACYDHSVRMTVFDPDKTFDNIEYLYNLGAKFIKVNIPHDVKLDDDYFVKMRKVKSKVLASKHLRDMTSLSKEPLHIPKVKEYTHCNPGEQYVSITVNGDIYPCDLFALQNEYRLGDVFSGIDEDCMKGFLRAMNENKKEMCSFCIAEQIYDKEIALHNWNIRTR